MTQPADHSDLHQPQMSASPRYSPDGKWWWTGTQWVPAPQPPRTPFNTNAVIGIVVGMLVILGVASTVVSQQSDNDAEDSFNRVMCERYGGDYC